MSLTFRLLELSVLVTYRAEVETTNDSIQSRRMQAEYMEASTLFFSSFSNRLGLMAADRISKMDADETHAAFKIAVRCV